MNPRASEEHTDRHVRPGGHVMVLARGRMIVVCALAALLQAGCADKATSPSVPERDVSLVVSPTGGDPSSPVVADARITNVGKMPVWHCDGCGCGNGVELTVLGPDGTVVWLHDPRAVGPACPDGVVPLEPGRDVRGRLVFTGTLFMIG